VGAFGLEPSNLLWQKLRGKHVYFVRMRRTRDASLALTTINYSEFPLNCNRTCNYNVKFNQAGFHSSVHSNCADHIYQKVHVAKFEYTHRETLDSVSYFSWDGQSIAENRTNVHVHKHTHIHTSIHTHTHTDTRTHSHTHTHFICLTTVLLPDSPAPEQ